MLPNLGQRFFVILLVLLIPSVWMVFGDFNWGLDIQGGTSLIYNVPDDPTDEQLEEVKEVMRQRVDKLGLKEITITTDKGRNDIIIELPGMSAEEAKRVKDTLLELGQLVWAIEATNEELRDPINGLGPRFDPDQWRQAQLAQAQKIAQANPRHYDEKTFTGFPVLLYNNPQDPTKARAQGQAPSFKYFPPNRYKDKKGQWAGPGVGAIVHIKQKATLTGEDVARVSPRQQGFEEVVSFEMVPDKKDALRDLTSANKGRNLCVMFNEKLVTRPVINQTLPGGGVIQGIDNREEVRKLVVTIKSGSLKIKPKLFMEQQIGPTLGEDAIRRGGMAILVGSLLVLVFMVWVYRIGGILANIALVMNLVVLLGVMQMMGATLSLPGIAGIILTVGIAVDANILIFERIREEREKGKTFVQAVKNGYGRATVTILDANITTLITGFVLYMFGTGAVKGFAFVLIAGLLVNLFTAIYMTKTVVAWLIDRKSLTDLKVTRLFTPPKIDFLAMGKAAMGVSLLLIIGGLVLFFSTLNEIRGLDFSGGVMMRVQLNKNMETAEFRQTILGIEGIDQNLDIVSVEGNIAEGSGTNVFEVKVPAEEETAEGIIKKIRGALEAKQILAPNPIVPNAAYRGATGDKPGRIPPIAQPKNDEEKAAAIYPNGFAFQINFLKPAAKTTVEGTLKTLSNTDARVTIVGGGNASKNLGYNVLMAAGPYATRDLGAITADLVAELRKVKPEALHLSDPVPITRFIGVRVAQDFVNKAILAIIVSIIALVIYIRVRFKDFTYGVGASAALVHDVLITMGAIALFDKLGFVNVKISLPIIAAFLTIIGYSLNDTIVIFDRLRENLGKQAMDLKEAMNLAITQSLTRTFFTSVTTFFVVGCLFVFNYGQRGVLEGLGFALMVGVISGTYSTIFIACPTVLFLSKRKAEAAKAKPGGDGKSKPATA